MTRKPLTKQRVSARARIATVLSMSLATPLCALVTSAATGCGHFGFSEDCPAGTGVWSVLLDPAVRVETIAPGLPVHVRRRRSHPLSSCSTSSPLDRCDDDGEVRSRHR